MNYDESQVSLEEMYKAISDLGYSPGIEEKQSDDSSNENRSAVPDLVVLALNEAAEDGKLVLLDFYAEWCIACKALDESVFSQPSVISALDNYVFLKIDTDLHEAVAAYYDVVGMPTLVILGLRGDEIHRSIGMLDPEEFAQKLVELFEK
ncbi:MAG: hypothetical protein COB36_09790 [Alphaproteobacteria bacterium]|nr:MAG: hypothetical protein COB36_09790 [Alphaproteobacteria bacterium]